MCRDRCLSLQIFPSEALRRIFDFFRRTGGHNPAALFSAAWSHINDIVGTADDIQIMLDHNHSCPVQNKGLKNAEQGLHIQR